MTTYIAVVGAENARWLASSEFLNGNAWDISADGGTVRFGDDLLAHMTGLPSQFDGHVDASGQLWIEGDPYRVRVFDASPDFYCGCCGGDASQPPKGLHDECCASLHDAR